MLLIAYWLAAFIGLVAAALAFSFLREARVGESVETSREGEYHAVVYGPRVRSLFLSLVVAVVVGGLAGWVILSAMNTPASGTAGSYSEQCPYRNPLDC